MFIHRKHCTLLLFAFLFLVLCSALKMVWAADTQININTKKINTEKIKVALFIDHGANARQQLRNELIANKDLETTFIYGGDIRNGCLNDFDVLLVPGGSGKKEALSIGSEGQDEVRRFIRNGGIYMGICAGCYLITRARPEYLDILPLTTVDRKHWRRGKAMLPIEFTPLGMEVFGVDKPEATVLYHNGPVLRKVQEPDAEAIYPLCYYRGEIVAKEGTKGLMVDAPAIVLGRYGKGIVLGISPHPEATPGLEAIEINAIHWLYKHQNFEGASYKDRPL